MARNNTSEYLSRHDLNYEPSTPFTEFKYDVGTDPSHNRWAETFNKEFADELKQTNGDAANAYTSEKGLSNFTEEERKEYLAAYVEQFNKMDYADDMARYQAAHLLADNVYQPIYRELELDVAEKINLLDPAVADLLRSEQIDKVRYLYGYTDAAGNTVEYDKIKNVEFDAQDMDAALRIQKASNAQFTTRQKLDHNYHEFVETLADSKTDDAAAKEKMNELLNQALNHQQQQQAQHQTAQNPANYTVPLSLGYTSSGPDINADWLTEHDGPELESGIKTMVHHLWDDLKGTKPTQGQEAYVNAKNSYYIKEFTEISNGSYADKDDQAEDYQNLIESMNKDYDKTVASLLNYPPSEALLTQDVEHIKAHIDGQSEDYIAEAITKFHAQMAHQTANFDEQDQEPAEFILQDMKDHLDEYKEYQETLSAQSAWGGAQPPQVYINQDRLLEDAVALAYMARNAGHPITGAQPASTP